jgi:hypothetical protein
MFAYMSVLSHPFFAVSDKDGNYKLPAGLPPGTYVLAARHQKAGEIQQTCKITPNRGMVTDFNFNVPPRLTRL